MTNTGFAINTRLVGHSKTSAFGENANIQVVIIDWVYKATENLYQLQNVSKSVA